jgi:hypothetical protein
VTPFGAVWADLTLEHLEAFLDGAGDEPLTWEAKADGDQPLNRGTVRKAICAFANSDLGGYLILGAARVGDVWQLVGLSRPPPDLSAWISGIARDVRPTPAVDVKTWPKTAKRGVVAVVWVPTVPEPPAMTNDGVVYQRVSGASPAVTDGRVLASLFAKGEAARSAAEQIAERAVTNAVPVEGRGLNSMYATFGFAATGGPKDRSAVLFSAPMIATIERAAEDLYGSAESTHPSRWLRDPVRATMQQDHVAIRVERLDGHVAELTVGWDGSVAVAFAAKSDAEEPLLYVATREMVKHAWTAAATILEAYGATGQVHLAMVTWERVPDSIVEVGRWTDVRAPTEDELASVRRELQRAMGTYVLEE